ncbi:hypothetical protein [Kingella oralis]|uniref:hypothetical protein n=1 Tax=Kingella oralis TaxID=505 RepID=UPI0034E5E33E
MRHTNNPQQSTPRPIATHRGSLKTPLPSPVPTCHLSAIRAPKTAQNGKFAFSGCLGHFRLSFLLHPPFSGSLKTRITHSKYIVCG